MRINFTIEVSPDELKKLDVQEIMAIAKSLIEVLGKRMEYEGSHKPENTEGKTQDKTREASSVKDGYTRLPEFDHVYVD